MSFGDHVAQEQTKGDVWVCNSDGYVGQVCLLTMIPEATVKNSLTVCSTRIVCVSAVPGAKLTNSKAEKNNLNNTAKRMDSNASLSSKKSAKSSKSSLSSSKHSKKSIPSESDDDDIAHGAESIIAFDSSDDEDAMMGTNFIGGYTI